MQAHTQVAPHLPQSNVVVQQQMVPPTHTGTSPIKQNYPHKQALVLGAIQTTVGCLCFVFQIVAISVNATAAVVGAGIWCGILFAITGSLGIVSAKQRTSGWIVTFMVLSIISAVFTVAVLVTSAIGAGIDNDPYFGSCSNYIPGYTDSYGFWVSGYCADKRKGPKVGINAVLICLSLVEAVVSIWSSAICCAGVCCGGTTTTGAVIYYNQAGGAVPGQVMVVNQGQPMGGQVMYTSPMQTTYIQGAPTTVAYPGQQQPGVGQAMPGPMAPPPYAVMSQNQYPSTQPGSTPYQMHTENRENESKHF